MNPEQPYCEELSASEPMRKLYADSISNAVAVLRVAANRQRSRLTTPAQLAARREEYRNCYRHMLGIDICYEVFGIDMPEASTELISERNGETISRIKLKICDGVYFTGLLLVPAQRQAKAPLAIMAHGGGGTPQLCCDLVGPNHYGGVVQKLLDRGCIVFAPQLLLWNRTDANNPAVPLCKTPYDRHSADNEMRQCGVSIAGFEIYEIMRALDYLCTLATVDHNRVGMLGLSYGGFYTLYAMAADVRIRSGWSAAFFNDRTRYCWRDMVWNGAARMFLDPEVAGLCAPRRLWLDVGTEDEVFDSQNIEELFGRTRDFFTAAGALPQLRCNLWKGGHRFSTDGNTTSDDDASSEGSALDFFLEGMNAYV